MSPDAEAGAAGGAAGGLGPPGQGQLRTDTLQRGIGKQRAGLLRSGGAQAGGRWRGSPGLTPAPVPTRDPPRGLCSVWGPFLGAEQTNPDPGPSQGEAALTCLPAELVLRPFCLPPPDTRPSWENPAAPAVLGRGLQRLFSPAPPPASCTAPFVAGGETGPQSLCPLLGAT